MKRKLLILLSLACIVLFVGCDRMIAPSRLDTVSQEQSAPEEGLLCTILIDCSCVLKQDSVDPAIREILPEDGVIFPKQQVAFSDGETVADVLGRVCRENKIPLDISVTPGSQSLYVKAIANLREFDGGPSSGWLYCVNAAQCAVASSEYKLSAGDYVEWRYSCEFGDDIVWSGTDR